MFSYNMLLMQDMETVLWTHFLITCMFYNCSAPWDPFIQSFISFILRSFSLFAGNVFIETLNNFTFSSGFTYLTYCETLIRKKKKFHFQVLHRCRLSYLIIWYVAVLPRCRVSMIPLSHVAMFCRPQTDSSCSPEHHILLPVDKTRQFRQLTFFDPETAEKCLMMIAEHCWARLAAFDHFDRFWAALLTQMLSANRSLIGNDRISCDLFYP